MRMPADPGDLIQKDSEDLQGTDWSSSRLFLRKRAGTRQEHNFGRLATIVWGWGVSMMGYFGIWWPIILDYMAFQVALLGLLTRRIEIGRTSVAATGRNLNWKLPKLQQSKVAQNRRPLYPNSSLSYCDIKAPNYGLLSFRV